MTDGSVYATFKHMTGTNEGYTQKKDHGPPKVKNDLKPLLAMRIV
jgi:hypothetical protein